MDGAEHKVARGPSILESLLSDHDLSSKVLRHCGQKELRSLCQTCRTARAAVLGAVAKAIWVTQGDAGSVHGAVNCSVNDSGPHPADCLQILSRLPRLQEGAVGAAVQQAAAVAAPGGAGEVAGGALYMLLRVNGTARRRWRSN